jgi:hypothetical protein
VAHPSSVGGIGKRFGAAVRLGKGIVAAAFEGSPARQTGGRIRQALDRSLDQVSEINRTVAERRRRRPTRREFPTRESSERDPPSPTVPRSDSAQRNHSAVTNCKQRGR